MLCDKCKRLIDGSLADCDDCGKRSTLLINARGKFNYKAEKNGICESCQNKREGLIKLES